MICFIDTHIVILFCFISYLGQSISTKGLFYIESIVRFFCARRDPLLSLLCTAASSFPFLSLSWLRCLTSSHRTAYGPLRLCPRIITISFRIQICSVCERDWWLYDSARKTQQTKSDKILIKSPVAIPYRWSCALRIDFWWQTKGVSRHLECQCTICVVHLLGSVKMNEWMAVCLCLWCLRYILMNIGCTKATQRTTTKIKKERQQCGQRIRLETRQRNNNKLNECAHVFRTVVCVCMCSSLVRGNFLQVVLFFRVF